MKKKAYVKNQIQIIKKTKARFLSIFCIVFLGAAFFAGLRHTSLIMEASMDRYLNNYQVNDLEYIATLGFKQSDIDEILKIDEVKIVEKGNRFDALIQYNDNTSGTVVYTNDSFNNEVNKIEVVTGRLPLKDNECIVDNNYAKHRLLKVNSKVILSNDNGSKEFTVVGLVNDPRYFSVIERGTNTLGDGTNSAFVEILNGGNESLALPNSLYEIRGNDIFNDLRVVLKSGENHFSDTYLEDNKEVNKKIKKILNKGIDKVNDDLIGDANDKYNDGLASYNQGMNDYNDGINKYNDGLSQYESGLIQYNDGLNKYNDGKKQYDEGLAQYNDGVAKYNEGLAKYQSGLQQYNQGVIAYNTGLSQYDDGNSQYQDSLLQYQSAKKQFDLAVNNGMLSSEEIIEQQAKLQTFKATLDATKSQLDQSKQELDKNKIVLDNTKSQLASSLDTLNSTKTKLDESKVQLDSSNQTLITSKEQLDSAKLNLDTNKPLLDDTKNKLDEAKKSLDQAKIDLDNAKKEIDDIPTSKLISLTREENASIISYISTCDSMSALSVVFPLIFFLVSALVSLTTMTRMVEEQRVQSGTFRALGYDKKDVINQYLIYGFLATFVACILGVVVGVYFFPYIIYFLYCKMLFTVGAPIKTVFDTSICLLTFVISVAITLLVTYLVVKSELGEMPASLLRPRAPKLGKRIVLERIDFIWKRLSFNQKVTMRNIFRYKKRFFMSIIGIAGCSALIVTGVGIKDSVSTLADRQYGEIFTYDGLVVYDKNLSKEDLSLQQAQLKQQDVIKDIASFHRQSVSVKGNKDYYTTLEVFSNNNEFIKHVDSIDYKTGDKLSLDDNGVIITEKLAELLGVNVGDNIKFTIGQDEYQVKVEGTMLLHFQHYMYMSDKLYESLLDKEPVKNYTYVNLIDGSDQKDLKAYCDSNDNIESLNYIKGISQSFRDQMGSINSVVFILIVCAGALAFIVLYNLTNINIQERKSEIATIKVLGFYPREVYDYVFRENIILSFIGSITGLVLGKLLHMFIISTVEVEVALFVRSVSLASYIFAMFMTLLFTYLINFSMRRVLKNVDMVESLKSIE